MAARKRGAGTGAGTARGWSWQRGFKPPSLGPEVTSQPGRASLAPGPPRAPVLSGVTCVWASPSRLWLLSPTPITWAGSVSAWGSAYHGRRWIP